MISDVSIRNPKRNKYSINGRMGWYEYYAGYSADFGGRTIIEQDKICQNCSSFFQDSRDFNTDFGICLDDEVFEPFLDEILDPWAAFTIA